MCLNTARDNDSISRELEIFQAKSTFFHSKTCLTYEYFMFLTQRAYHVILENASGEAL